MGIWNSHTSVGNILGSLIAGIWVNGQWGLSFVVPGIITAIMGVITFLFLIEREWAPHSPQSPQVSLECLDFWEKAARSTGKIAGHRVGGPALRLWTIPQSLYFLICKIIIVIIMSIL